MAELSLSGQAQPASRFYGGLDVQPALLGVSDPPLTGGDLVAGLNTTPGLAGVLAAHSAFSGRLNAAESLGATGVATAGEHAACVLIQRLGGTSASQATMAATFDSGLFYDTPLLIGVAASASAAEGSLVSPRASYLTRGAVTATPIWASAVVDIQPHE